MRKYCVFRVDEALTRLREAMTIEVDLAEDGYLARAVSS
jgi:hypothetical protein